MVPSPPETAMPDQPSTPPSSLTQGALVAPTDPEPVSSDRPPPAFAKAIALHREGRADEARLSYLSVLDDGPAPVRRAAATNLARIEMQAGRLAEAARLFRSSLAIDAAQPSVMRDLGAVLLASGDGASAMAALRDALAMRPADPAVLELLGRAELAVNDPAAALASFDGALAVAPDAIAARFNRGMALRALGRHRDAAAAFSQALALRPDLAEAHNNLGRALQDAGDPAGAAIAYARALDLAPALAPARLNLAALALEGGRFAEAAAGFAAARDRAADDAALAGLVHARQQACDWAGLEGQRATLISRIAEGATVPPFMAIAAGLPDHLQARCAAAWAAGVAPRRRPRPPPMAPLRAPQTGPLRLGYLSGDFHDHATVHLIADVIARHDRATFAVHGYSYGPDDGSPARTGLSRAFDRFVDLAGLGDDAAADRIRADAVDVLVDLKGYTAHARPQIVALRPAAVQVNWLGFPGTMGAEFIDAVLADDTTAPPSLQPLCTERIVRLPDCFQPLDTTRPIGEALPRPAYGLPDRGFVFCCFNNSYKIAPDIFAVWMRLLGRVEGSVLWLLAGSAEVRANLVREAAAAGVDPSRLVFAPRLPMAEHLARHRAADLFLDTQPVSAMTTAGDALWAGLPVLTSLGATVSGRGGASLVRAAGLPELVTLDIERYELLALALARSPERLAAVRHRLAAQRGTAPLFDPARFVRGLEAALKGLVA